MATKLTILTLKIAIHLHLVAEDCTISSSRSRRPVRKFLGIPSYNAVADIAAVSFSVHLKSEDVQWRTADVYEGVSRSFRTQSITKYTLTTINTGWEATQRVMAAKLTRLTHKIAIQLHLVTESCTICSSAPGGQSGNFWKHHRTWMPYYYTWWQPSVLVMLSHRTLENCIELYRDWQFSA
jgi:hypothetical protein